MIKKYTQNGRSMIEMLGVLAIIGVLSIGGIAGYSKAMSKYRVNKTADQISQLAQNIRTLYASQKNYNTLNDTVIKKAHLAPEDMYESTGSTTLYNPFGGSVVIGFSGKNSRNDNKAFYITVNNIPVEACFELVTKDWGSGSSSGFIAIGYAGGAKFSYDGCPTSTGVNCASSGVMDMQQATFLCEGYASRNDDQGITWKFY